MCRMHQEIPGVSVFNVNVTPRIAQERTLNESKIGNSEHQLPGFASASDNSSATAFTENPAETIATLGNSPSGRWNFANPRKSLIFR